MSDLLRALPGQYLSFFLAGEEYATGILQVREIIEYDSLTRVPMTPSWIRGVLNLRGRVVPVVDMALKFGLEATEISKHTCVVIVEVDIEGEATVMGVLVDAVSQVLDLKEEQLEPTPAFGTRVRTEFLQGVGAVDEKFILILDINRVLALDELVEVASLENAAPQDGLDVPGLTVSGTGVGAVEASSSTESAPPEV